VRLKDVEGNWASTFNAILNLMCIQESKVTAKETKTPTGATRQVASVASSNVDAASNIGSPSISVPLSSISTSSSIPLPSSSTVTPRRKRSAPDPIPIDSKRTRQQGPPTPNDQLTKPTWSGDSHESQHEESTKMLLHQFLQNTLSQLDTEFCRLYWSKSPHPVELLFVYVYSHFRTNYAGLLARQGST
jgi:hypothetical protein